MTTEVQLNADNDDDSTASDDDDDDAGTCPRPAKLPRLDALWTWEKCDEDCVQPPRLSVNQPEQLLADIPDDPSPYDFFNLYVTDDLLDLMVRETNRYAAQFRPIADNIGSLKPHSLVHND